jgi:glycosyltransferase involved in cell wall biosynthesis
MTDETGILVPPGEPDALADAVVKLLDDEPRRQSMGAAARRLAEERYSWDEIGRRLAAVYEELT